MANHHLDRLLRLARRTGDRIIVTDERGSEEPLVILPLDEYESLIEGAFGPGELPMRMHTPMAPSESAGPEAWETISEEEALEDIHIEDVSDEHKVDDEALGPEEADVDEEALKSLWVQPETEKTEEKPKEVLKKSRGNDGSGEEGFYLEAID